MVSPNFCCICSTRPVRPPRECSCLGGVSTFAGMPSDLAPGSEVKLSGEVVLPYRPQPIAMPSTTSTPATAARIPHPLPAPPSLAGLRQVGQLNRGVRVLQIVDQRLQLAQGGGIGGGLDPLPVLGHRQLTFAQRAVENLARVVPVAVLRPGARCLPASPRR